MGNSKLWTKDFIIVFFLNFFISLIVYLLLVIASMYAVETFQASISEAGLVTGIFIVGTLVGRLFIGKRIIEFGLRKTLYVGLILFAVTTGLYFFEYNTNILLVTRFLNGLMFGVASTAVLTIAASIIPAKRKGEGIGYFSLSSILSVALGPFLGIYLSQHVSYQLVFVLCIILALSCMIISFFLFIPKLEESEEKNEAKGFRITNYLELKAVPIAFVVLIIGGAFSSILTFINFYAVERDLVNAASFFFIVYAIAVLVSRPFSGRMLDVKGANYVMYPGFVLFAAGLFLLSMAPNGFLFLLSAALIGLGFGNMQSCTQAIALTIVPQDRIGMATSTFFIFLDFGIGFGPYVLGMLVQNVTYSELYAILGGVILLSPVLYHLLHGKKAGIRKRAGAR